MDHSKIADLIPIVAEKLSVEDLPEHLQLIAGEFGIEMALRMSERLGGLSLYIPKIENLLRSEMHEKIRKGFNGSNHKQLARTYGITEKAIRDILKGG